MWMCVSMGEGLYSALGLNRVNMIFTVKCVNKDKIIQKNVAWDYYFFKCLLPVHLPSIIHIFCCASLTFKGMLPPGTSVLCSTDLFTWTSVKNLSRSFIPSELMLPINDWQTEKHVLHETRVFLTPLNLEVNKITETLQLLKLRDIF